MAAGRTNQPCLPDKSGVKQGLSVPKKSSFLWSSSQVSGYLPEMAASMSCSSLLLLGTAERFVEGLQEVCECGPGCLVCQGGTSQQKVQHFCQGKL